MAVVASAGPLSLDEVTVQAQPADTERAHALNPADTPSMNQNRTNPALLSREPSEAGQADEVYVCSTCGKANPHGYSWADHFHGPTPTPSPRAQPTLKLKGPGTK